MRVPEVMVTCEPISINSGRISSKYTPDPIKQPQPILMPAARKIAILRLDGKIGVLDTITHIFEKILRMLYGRLVTSVFSFMIFFVLEGILQIYQRS